MNTICKKVSYSSEKFANEDIERLHNSTRKVVPIRSYLCKKCSTYHLTSARLCNNILIQELITSNLELQSKKHKKKLFDFKQKYVLKCKEFEFFKRDVNLLIKKLEESEVSNG